MINSIKEMLPVACRLIERQTQDRVMNVTPVNKRRHYVIITGTGMKYYLLFKRAYFRSFGDIFDKKGIGESINREWLQFALRRGIDAFLFSNSQGNIYKVPTIELADWATKNQAIRVQKITKEITYHIPVGLLSRWR